MGQIHRRDTHLEELLATHPQGLRHGRLFVLGCQLPRATHNPLCVQLRRHAALFERTLNPRYRMLPQQLQNPHVVPNPSARAVTRFQLRPKTLKDRRQLPVTIHR
jgi:hypothetical protein